MKNDKWHYTDKGPKKCRWGLQPCTENRHFDSQELALAFGDKLKKTAAQDKKIAKLEEMIKAYKPEEKVLASVVSGSYISGARCFGDAMEKSYDNGVLPKIFPGQWSARIQNGSYRPVEITLKRHVIVHKEWGVLSGTWEAIVETTKTHPKGFETIREETKLNLSNPLLVRGRIAVAPEFAKLQEVFRRAIYLSLVDESNPKNYLIGVKASELMESFMQMFNAVESEAMGEAALDRIGFGYFQDSPPGHIKVNEQYAFSAFRGSNFRRYLNQSEYFRNSVPIVDLRVTDNSLYSKAYWSLYYCDDLWSVEFRKADGETGEYAVETPQDAYTAVHHHVLNNESRVGDEKTAHRKGDFAFKLVFDVNAALAKHKERIEAHAGS